MKKIFIIAGESSGDKIGALVISKLSAKSELNFKGIGGSEMEKVGLKSLFPICQISLMGFFEILPHIFRLRKLINMTIETAIKYNPDIVITIDSPGFSYRVANALHGKIHAKFVHIVAPSVWAYKPERAAKYAKIYDLLLTLLPFEPPYFEKEGLKSTFVGHFALEQKLCAEKDKFRIKHNIEREDKLIAVTPGSRAGEVKRHMPVLIDAMKLLEQNYKVKFVFIAANKEMNYLITNFLKEAEAEAIVTSNENAFEAYKASDLVLGKSGTNSLEIALHMVPQITFYKLNIFSWLYIKSVAKTKYANIINYIANREIISELLQVNFSAKILAKKASEILDNKKIAKNQIDDAQAIISQLSAEISPSEMSAREILKL